MPARFGVLGAAVLALSAAAAAAAAESPKVVASIVPVHSLVANVMRGVGTPELLVKGAASPHDYALRPSDARALAEADLVVWVGGALESFLVKTLETYAADTRVLTLLEAPGIVRLEVRAGGAWEAHAHEEAPHDDEEAAAAHAHAHDEEELDAHIWLDPANARAIVAAVAAALAEIDPGNADLYRRNAEAAAASLDALSGEIAASLEPVRRRPYIVFHDAYQYFEHAFATNAVGAVTLSPEQKPGARRLQALRRRLAEAGVACVFAEPNFDAGLVQAVIAGTPARIGTLDPEGATLPPGPDAYFALMRGIADSLRGCLAATN